MDYQEEDYLSLSGIQHFEFCKRQWALIHIEQQWQENLRTVEGSIFHKKAHDGSFTEKRKDIITTRGMRVFSRTLGISGICDIVEFHLDHKNGVPIYGREGKYSVYPVEYKNGEPKVDDMDILQIVAQVMCLEEMLCCEITRGYLFYGRTRRRIEITITDALRNKVREDFNEMHQYYERRYTPKVKRSKSCNACSLKEVCLPVLCKDISVKGYINKRINEELDTCKDYSIHCMLHHQIVIYHWMVRIS